MSPCSLRGLMSLGHSCETITSLYVVLAILNRLRRFHTDPSGTFVRYEAKAIGSGSEAAQSELQDKWHSVRHDSIHSRSAMLTDSLLIANDATRSTGTHATGPQAGDGREAGSAQCTTCAGAVDSCPRIIVGHCGADSLNLVRSRPRRVSRFSMKSD